jgi:hypothetical protein
LKDRYQQAQDQIEARRWHLLYLVNQQWTVKRAAESVGLNYDYAKEIVRRYNQNGEAGIKNRSQRGKPSPRSLLTLPSSKNYSKRFAVPRLKADAGQDQKLPVGSLPKLANRSGTSVVGIICSV